MLEIYQKTRCSYCTPVARQGIVPEDILMTTTIRELNQCPQAKMRDADNLMGQAVVVRKNQLLGYQEVLCPVDTVLQKDEKTEP